MGYRACLLKSAVVQSPLQSLKQSLALGTHIDMQARPACAACEVSAGLVAARLSGPVCVGLAAARLAATQPDDALVAGLPGLPRRPAADLCTGRPGRGGTRVLV